MPVVTAEQLLAERPEIFDVKPRSGGVLNVEEVKQPCRKENDPKTKKIMSRQHRIDQVLKNRMAGNEDDIMNLSATKVAKDSMDMLAVTISCIMLMASGSTDVPREHLVWTSTYLKCIVNEFGDYPPNVQGILNHIQMSSGDLSALIEAEDDSEGAEAMAKTIRTITTVRQGGE